MQRLERSSKDRDDAPNKYNQSRLNSSLTTHIHCD